MYTKAGILFPILVALWYIKSLKPKHDIVRPINEISFYNKI